MAPPPFGTYSVSFWSLPLSTLLKWLSFFLFFFESNLIGRSTSIRVIALLQISRLEKPRPCGLARLPPGIQGCGNAGISLLTPIHLEEWIIVFTGTRQVVFLSSSKRIQLLKTTCPYAGAKPFLRSRMVE